MYAIIFHAHQKLDRVAHRHLSDLLTERSFFPSIKQILHFEAGHGPDGAKLKQHEDSAPPWHFVDPLNTLDTALHEQIGEHYNHLVQELKKRDQIRAAFEAAWLAHALVDGLTPAHHFPYEAELERLRSGEPHQTRKGLVGRIYVKSDTVVETVHRSLKLIGPKGLLTSHALFEAGAYAIIAPLRLNKAKPTAKEIEQVLSEGIVIIFKQVAREVAQFNLYDRFCESGWIRSVNHDIRVELAPRMVRIITLAWYAAVKEADQAVS